MITADKKTTAATHPDYEDSIGYLTTIRACMIGSPAIKKGGHLYLPHPSQIDKTSVPQIARYNELLNGAEFDSYPDDTRREILGKMRIGDSIIEVPDKLNYLIDNIDGNGMASDSAIEFAINNVYQTKFHALVIDFKGAPSDTAGMSKAEQTALNARAVIKQYTRENIINWNFSKVNGVMQLSFIQFRELGYKFDPETGSNEEEEKYLVLALDENGYYYQAKYTQDETLSTAEKDYQKIKMKPLDRLPVLFVADEEILNDSLPLQLGYLWGICDATLARYRVSASYKETQRNIAPTIMTSGWKTGDLEIFTEANNGRSYIATGAGAVNNMPEGITSEILSASPEMMDYHWYFEQNEKKIKLMGGSVSNQGAAMTATEADISASKQNALMNTVADNAEDSFKRAIFWCGLFEGIYTFDTFDVAMKQIKIELPRDFATPKLSVEEAKEYREQVINSLLSREDYTDIMVTGGWYKKDAITLLAAIEESPPVTI